MRFCLPAGLFAAYLASLIATTTVAAAEADPPLIGAVKNGNREVVLRLLKARADVNGTEVDGTTALHWAVRADDLETVQLLLRAGARANAANRYGVTPLSLAATNGRATMIECSLEADASANTTLPRVKRS
jgi:ankyrin repeat protein